MTAEEVLEALYQNDYRDSKYDSFSNDTNESDSDISTTVIKIKNQEVDMFITETFSILSLR